MSQGYQQITLKATIGSEINMRYTPSGVPVADFRVAVNRTWSNENGKQEHTLWLKIVAWRKQAELASQYLDKGREVLVIGELEDPEQWTGKDGTNRVTQVVTAQKIVFLGGGKGSATGHEAPGDAQGMTDEQVPF